MSKRISLFYAVTALFWFSLYSYMPIISPYSQELNASIFLTGLIAGSYGFTQMVCRIPIGIFSDITKKRKSFVICGIILSIVSGLGVFFMANQYTLLFFRGLSGVAASFWVIFTILFSSYYKSDESMKAIGILNSANSIGTVLGMFFGGIVANQWGFKYSFLLAAISGFLALLLSFGVEENSSIQRKPLKLKEILTVAVQEKNLLKVSMLAVILQFVVFGSTYGFATLVAKDLGANSFQLGLLNTVSMIPGFFIAPLSGTLFVRKIGYRNAIVCGFALTSLACIAIPFSVNLNMLFATQFIGGIGRNIIFPLLMGLSIREVPEERRATAMGFFQAIYSLGMFVGPTVTGFIGNFWGMTMAFVITGFIGFFGLGATFFFIRQKS